MLDEDAKAAAIAAMLRANDIEFKFKGEGDRIQAGSGKLAWRWVEVVAIHPKTGKEWTLQSFQAAAKLLRSLGKERA
jgi:hypothetical protein